MTSFFSAERPLEIIERGIQHEFQPLAKSEKKHFKNWLRVTKQEIDSRDSQFARKLREAQIAYQKQKIIKQQLYQTKILRNRTLRNKLIKSGIVQKNRFPRGFGRSVRRLHKYSFIGGTLFRKKHTKKYTKKNSKKISNNKNKK
jgi:hypothetical protein